MAPHELRRAARTDMGSVPNNVACDERVIAPLGDTRTLAALAAPRLSAWQERKAEELMSHNLSGSADVKDIARSCRIRSEEHTSELQSLMRNSYAVFCLQKKKNFILPH